MDSVADDDVMAEVIVKLSVVYAVNQSEELREQLTVLRFAEQRPDSYSGE